MVSDLFAVPIVAVALGLVGIYTGWKRWRTHGQIAALTPTPVRELAESGLVEVEGRAVPAEEPVTAPVSGREAAVAAWKVEEWDERGDTATWREVARGIELPAIEVRDDTGGVEVAPVSNRETAGKWTQTTGVSASDGVRIDDVLAEFDAFPVEAELFRAGDRARRDALRARPRAGARRPDPETVPTEGRRGDPARGRTVHHLGSGRGEPRVGFGSAAKTLVAAGALATVLGVAGLAYMLLPR